MPWEWFTEAWERQQAIDYAESIISANYGILHAMPQEWFHVERAELGAWPHRWHLHVTIDEPNHRNERIPFVVEITDKAQVSGDYEDGDSC